MPSAKRPYFSRASERYLKFVVPDRCRLLVFGGSDVGFLQSLRSESLVNIVESTENVGAEIAHAPNVELIRVQSYDESLQIEALETHGPFDAVIFMDTLGMVKDIQKFLERLHPLCSDDTRLINMYFNYAWGPLFWIAEQVGLKTKVKETNWLKMSDVENLFNLSGYDVVRKEWRVLAPFFLFGFGEIINRFFATLPIIRKACARHFLIARRVPVQSNYSPSVSIIIPCRNERGNIESAVKRIPQIGSKTELIFVEGMSSDGTWEEIVNVERRFPEKNIRYARQEGIGKGDAVRHGFKMAHGDILMILDADLTVPPEDLPKFYNVIHNGEGEFINGTRLVYSRENHAMRFLNLVANHLFASIFSYLLNQRITDTLCGTKVLSRRHYERISQNRVYFGDFDPFGDFDLIFGAAKLNLKSVEVPIRYASRRYGETQISRFSHGFLLLRMVLFAYRKLKAI